MVIDDESEIIRIGDLFQQAFETGVYKLAMKHISNDVNGFGTNSDEIILNKSKFTESINKQSSQQTMEHIKIKFESEIKNVTLIDSNAAFLMNYGNFIMTSSEGIVEYEIRTTLIFKKINNQWMVCHLHVSFPFIGSEEGIPLPKIESISRNISKWLNILENNTFSEQLRDPYKTAQLKEYLKQAKDLLEN